MPTYSNWTSTTTPISYVPKEKPVYETVGLFTSSTQGIVPPTQNESTNTGQYILAQDGTWIPQPSFSSGGSNAYEILRPAVLGTSYSAYPPTVTNTAYAYDADTNHATTFAEFECASQTRINTITDTLTYSTFASRAQTWTAATINVSRAYGYFDDGESNATTGASNRNTSVKIEYSINNGTNWFTLATDISTSIPSTATTSSAALSTTTPTMANILVKLTLVRGGGGQIYDPDTSANLPGSTGDIDLKIYDIWISGTYTSGAGNITCNDLLVTGDATLQNKLYDGSGSAGTAGYILSSTGTKTAWVPDSVGSGTVTSITTTGANGVTISGGSTQTITTSGTFALALGAITPTSIATGTGSFTGDVEFASSIKSPNGSNSPIVIAPDGTGDVHLNADSVRIGDNNANATIATQGTGDLIITTHEGSANEGIVRLYDGVNGDITLTPNGSGQVKVGTDQVVTLVASQTLTNKTISGSSNTLSNIANASTTATSANTASAIVARDASGNFSAGTITANLTGNASGSSGSTTGNAATATALQTARAINGVNFDGTAAITVTAAAGTLTGATLASGVTASSLTSVGTLTGLTVSGLTTVTNANILLSNAYYLSARNAANTLSLSLIGRNSSDKVAIDPDGYGVTMAGPLTVSGNATFDTNTLFVDATNDRVGIGTASPSEKLSVKSATGINSVTDIASLTNPSQTSAGVRMLFNNGYGNLGAISSFQLDNGAGADNGVLAFQTASDAVLSTKMTILDTGNVGIGTTSPNNYAGFKTLTINGTSGAEIDFTAGGSLIGYVFNDSSNLYMGGNTGKSAVFLANASEGMRLTSTGLGIGTASPTVGLHVVKDQGSGYIAAFRANVSSPYITFQTTSSITQIQGINSAFSATNDIAMQLSGGNVGIGTASPASKLNVSGGNVTVSAGYGIAWSGDQARIMTPEDNVSGALIRYGSGGICRFLNGSTEHLRVDSSGNLAALGVFKGNSGSKGFGGITTTTSTSTPTGGSSGDHYYIY